MCAQVNACCAVEIKSLKQIMDEFNVYHLVGAMDTMRHVLELVRVQSEQGNASGLVKDHRASNEIVSVGLNACKRVCEKLELDKARIRVSELIAYERSGALSFDHIGKQIPELFQDIDYDLSRRKFAYVEQQRAAKHYAFVEEWHPILEKIPESASDCCDAIDCYAIGLYTAGVYHCMRVAEFGLRRIARKLKVKTIDNRKPIPIEYADWHKVITGINAKIDEKRAKLTKSAKREEALAFYAQMADHCEYMKEYWRNPVSHARKRYNQGECLGALERVRYFMLLLARDR